MTSASSAKRAFLYIVIAVLTQANSDLEGAFSTDPIRLTKFWISLSLTAAITYRAYIDSSNSQVVKKTEPVAQPDK